MRETWVWSLGREDPWRRKWQPTPVFLPGESHGRRSLVGYIQSTGSQRVGHNWATSLSFHRVVMKMTWIYRLGNWKQPAPFPVVCLRKSYPPFQLKLKYHLIHEAFVSLPGRKISVLYLYFYNQFTVTMVIIITAANISCVCCNRDYSFSITPRR